MIEVNFNVKISDSTINSLLTSVVGFMTGDMSLFENNLNSQKAEKAENTLSTSSTSSVNNNLTSLDSFLEEKNNVQPQTSERSQDSLITCIENISNLISKPLDKFNFYKDCAKCLVKKDYEKFLSLRKQIIEEFHISFF